VLSLFGVSLIVSLHGNLLLGKPPALPEDSQSLTVPGVSQEEGCDRGMPSFHGKADPIVEAGKSAGGTRGAPRRPSFNATFMRAVSHQC